MTLEKWLLYVSLLFFAFGIRLTLILDSPQMDKWIDVAIYADGGQLIVNGVNPYNYLDNMELRDSLRRDTIAYNYFVDESQERWNFYAGSNLPLTILYFGLIEHIADGNLFWYRIVFALFDSILVVMLAVFIFQYWNVQNTRLLFLLCVGLGVLSPIMLYHGILLAEDKGLQILLMIGAIYFSKKQNLLLGSWFLGWSIAFKGLGVFISPLCLFYYLQEPASLNTVFDRKNITMGSFFIAATTIFALQPFILYLPDIFDMMFYRLDQNLNALVPTHSSVWRFVHLSFPDSWQEIKLVVTIYFVLINTAGLLTKKFGFNIITAGILLWFVDISLMAGSLDRMNIGFIVAILLLGMTHRYAGLLMSAFYVCAGSIIFFSGYAYVHKFDALDPELFDSAFSLLFVWLYLILLTYYVLKPKNTERSNSSKTVPNGL